MTMAADLLAQARQSFDSGDLERAENLARQILQMHPANPQACYVIGLVCQRQRRLEEALCYFAKVLRILPGSADVHNAMGSVLLAQNNLMAAGDAFRQALDVRPDLVAARNGLGSVLLAQGKAAEAEVCWREVVNQCPNLPEAHACLASALEAQGRREEAVACYRAALRLDPKLVATHNRLGNLLIAQGKMQEAADCYGTVLRLQPNCAEAYYRLGILWQKLGRLPQAAACYRRAIRLQQGFAAAHSGLGTIYVLQGQREAALACFQDALRLEPTHPMAHANLGSFLLEEGHLEEASAQFKEALRCDPNSGPAWAAVTRFGLFPLSHAEVEHVRALLARPGLAPAEACHLQFGLGSLYDRLGQCEQAFAHISQANALRRALLQESGMAFDADAHAARTDQMIATCDAAYFRRIRTFGRKTDRLVFIVGMPRSGTTLVEQILGSHPDVYAAGELGEMTDLARMVSTRMETSEDYPACLARLDAGTAEILADWYLEQVARRNDTAPRITDKMPSNLEHLGLVAALFPRARIIHCRRDPMDVALSCYFQDFRNVAYAFSLEDLGNYYVEYERLMAHWRSVLPLPMLEVSYEELVSEPETETRRLLSFCGLGWDDRCLAFYRSPRPARTSSVVQVRQPIYKTSVGRWRRYAAHLQPFRETLERATRACRHGSLAASEKNEPASARPWAPLDPEVKSNQAREQARMGDSLIREGDHQNAVGHYQEALCLDPACVPALAAVAWHGLYPLTEHELSRMQRLLADPHVPPDDAARLHFGLAHVHERAGAYEHAFEHFRQANTLRRGVFRDAGKVFDLAWYSTWIDQIIAHCDASYFEQIKGWGRDSRRPVFVVGMPRSGCTEAERILACHPQVHGGGELLEIGRLMAGLRQQLPTGEYYPKAMRLNAALCISLADHYERAIERLSTIARVTDRTPNNFQFLGLIAALFPQARVIHCRRDPLDVCFSCYIQDFMEWTLNLDEVAIFYREYERLMAHWRDVLPLTALEVAYEELLADPETVSRRMVSFCDLEWNERCLDLRAGAREGGAPPERQSWVGRWRHYAAQLQSLASALGRPASAD